MTVNSEELLRVCNIRMLWTLSTTSFLFIGVRPDTGINSTYCEKEAEAAASIAALKNDISENVDSKLVFSHIFTPENGDIGAFFTSREADKYRDTLLRQVRLDGLPLEEEEGFMDGSSSSDSGPPQSSSGPSAPECSNRVVYADGDRYRGGRHASS